MSQPFVMHVCGENPVLPAGIAGCGQPINTCAEVYRCTDCHIPFHRDCAIKHFSEDDVLTEDHLKSMGIEP